MNKEPIPDEIRCRPEVQAVFDKGYVVTFERKTCPSNASVQEIKMVAHIESLRLIQRANEHHYTAAHIEHRSVGSFLAEYKADDGRMVAINVSVKPDHRRNGVAKALIVGAALIAKCKRFASFNHTDDGRALLKHCLPVLQAYGIEVEDD